ncbi:hypothetical protein NDU88_001890 [Pleurodeles waltl]|uniref:Uncharacterized protein n=1 Tax=Pleurodeles waltl TaxID=8319 RepID=A0AAV7M0U6_PLEWA|nr:hypothetical protein NDU88_001890 [Pleurodeles waltl]
MVPEASPSVMGLRAACCGKCYKGSSPGPPLNCEQPGTLAQKLSPQRSSNPTLPSQPLLLPVGPGPLCWRVGSSLSHDWGSVELHTIDDG